MRNLILIGLLLALCVSPLLGQEYQQWMLAEASFNNAGRWDFRYCSNMPSHPYPNAGGGWYFDFPYSGGSVNYLTTAHETAITSKVISMTVQIQTSDGASVNSLDTGGGLPASARFFIQRKGDQLTAPYELYRWWSNPVSVQLKPLGIVVLTAALTPDQWSSVFGKFGNYNAITQAGFYEALNRPGNIGLTFGGGSSFGHGVYANGAAKFIVTNFALKDGFPPSYTVASVVNSAAFTTKLAAKSWTTVYGQDLAPDTIVKINGQPALIGYARSPQVNFLTPDVVGSVTLEVVTGNGGGSVLDLIVQREVMNLFSQSGNGKGLVAAQHWTTPGIPQGASVSVQYPVRPNYPVIFYADGLGNYGSLTSKPTIKINNHSLPSNMISYIAYSNGLYQINVDRLPLTEIGVVSTGEYKIQLCGGSVCGNELSLPIQTF